MSLSVLLDITAAHDFLRGLLSLLQEYDTVTDENLKARTVSRMIPLAHLVKLTLPSAQSIQGREGQATVWSSRLPAQYARLGRSVLLLLAQYRTLTLPAAGSDMC